uniref:Zinc finger protein n=1 Tax=Anopheles melas TaxID=34690 RepID=A0A182TGN8_9DIPT
MSEMQLCSNVKNPRFALRAHETCPTDPTIQQQWFTLLEVTEPDAMRALVDGRSKVCSCHFTEDCFGHHPVYGYRYLLATALPTVFPPRKEIEQPKPDGAELEKDPALDYFLVYLDDPPGPAFIDQVALAGVTNGLDVIGNNTPLVVKPEQEQATIQEDDAELQEESNDVVTIEDEDGEDDDAIEQIGIEYANGKYYFLKLDDEPAPVGDVLVSAEEPNGNELEFRNSATATTTDAEQEKSLHDLNENLQQLDKFVSQQDGGEADEYDEYEMDVSDKETEQFAGKQVHLETVEERSDTDVIEVKDDTEVDVVKEEYEVTSSKDTASDSETGGDENDYDCDALSEADYGPIEALEEVSVCGDKVRVRDENESLHRFFCEYCGRGFRFKSLKDRHTLVHTKMKKFCCEVCGRGFTQKINLTIHLRTHTGESGNKKFTCQICEKKCIRMSELEAHMTAHLRKFPHVCPLCQERYSDATGLYDHFQVEHRSEMTLRELIDLLSENENAIVISDKEAPSNIRRDDGSYECPVCSKTYRMEANLERHKRKMHVKIYNCPHCPRKFLYKSLLHKHLPSHTLEKPYQCPHCALSYTQRVNLRVHMERKHAQQLKQPKKEPKAASEPSFVVATLNADGDVVESIETAQSPASPPPPPRITGPRTHDCEECGKKFPRRASLLQHVAAHKKVHNPTTFDCEVCGISLAARVALEKHRWRVHGEQKNNMNVISNLDLRNVTILPTADNRYLELDVPDTISEDYEHED